MANNDEEKSKKKSPWREWRNRWNNFFTVVLEASVVIPIIVAVGLLWISLAQEEPLKPGIQAVLTIFISIAAGWAGASISRRWDEITEGSILVTRGESAIRSLKLLLRNISAIENRLSYYISQLDESNLNYELIKGNFEETIERCLTIQDEALNSIQDWADIVPGAEDASQIVLISELKAELRSTQKEQSMLEERLAKAESERTQELIDQVEAQLAARKNETDKLRKEIEQKSKQVNESPILRGLPGTISASPSPTGTSFGVANYSDYKELLLRSFVRDRLHKPSRSTEPPAASANEDTPDTEDDDEEDESQVTAFEEKTMINQRVISRVRNGVCAIGYLTVEVEQVNELLKDRSRRPDDFFEVIGTGFLIRETTVLTNRHVITDLKKVQQEKNIADERIALLFTYTTAKAFGQAFCECQGFVFPADIAQDIALLNFVRRQEVEFEQCKPLKIINTENQIKIGQPIGVLGFPHGSDLLDFQIKGGARIKRFGPMLYQGYISALAPFDKRLPVSDILLDVRSAGGMSGSPVFDAKSGNVIGIFYAGDDILVHLAKPLTRKRLGDLLEVHDKVHNKGK